MSNGVHAACSVAELFFGILVGVGLVLLSFFGVVATILAGLGALAATLNTIVGILGLLVVILFAFCIFRRLWRCCFGNGC
jgi:hypothetical protein